LGFDCDSFLFGMEDFTEGLRDSSSWWRENDRSPVHCDCSTLAVPKSLDNPRRPRMRRVLWWSLCRQITISWNLCTLSYS
jgi:hypothetical protein